MPDHNIAQLIERVEALEARVHELEVSCLRSGLTALNRRNAEAATAEAQQEKEQPR